MIEVRNIKDFYDYLDSLLIQSESDDLEFKSAAGGFPDSFWDTYAAFANTNGGTIVFGVAEKKDKLFLDGLSDEQIVKYRKDFWNNVNNRSSISCNLMKSTDVIDEEYKGHRFMLFFVPRAGRELRPVYRTTNPFNGTFKRNYEGDYKCTEQEVRRMFADADSIHPADGRILKNFGLEDLDNDALTRYRQLFKLSSPDHPWLSLPDIELLKMLGGYRKDRQTGEEGLTQAALLMFGKTLSITDEECCPNFFPDYQERLTEDEDIRWTNRIYADGTWETNLFNFVNKVLPRLQSVLPKPFNLENNIRRDETPAHIAIREALINLCIHADYSVNASLVVKLNPNGFVFSNPGTLLVSKDQYYTGGESVCRNKSLQKMFAMLGIAEKAGSGSDKILKGWRESNWRSPRIEEQTGPDKVTLFMPMESLLSDNAKQRLTEQFGFSANSFDHRVMSVLALAIDEDYVTNERLRYSLDLHKSEISDLLKLMVKNELLVSEGYGRGTRYYLPKVGKYNIGLGFGNYNASSDGNSASSENYNSASSDSNSASSDGNSASSDNNSASSDKKRLSKSEMKTLIINTCQDWMTIEEIVHKTGKSYSYLRNNIIPLFVADKTIEMLFPGNPTDPRQKYKVKE